MYPISYKKIDNKIEFFYDQKEWNEWIAQGKKTGNVGSMMKYIEDAKMITFFAFGTYENPMKDMLTIKIMHNPLFDGEGKLDEPDWYLKPLAEERSRIYWEEHIKDMRVIFLDFTDDNKIIDFTRPQFKQITMINQRVKLKSEACIKKGKFDRLGTITGETGNGTSWWILWGGRKTKQRAKKNMVDIASNIADIVNSIFVHKTKNNE